MRFEHPEAGQVRHGLQSAIEPDDEALQLGCRDGVAVGMNDEQRLAFAGRFLRGEVADQAEERALGFERVVDGERTDLEANGPLEPRGARERAHRQSPEDGMRRLERPRRPREHLSEDGVRLVDLHAHLKQQRGCQLKTEPRLPRSGHPRFGAGLRRRYNYKGDCFNCDLTYRSDLTLQLVLTPPADLRRGEAR